MTENESERCAQAFSFACGCVISTDVEGVSSMRWCPQHKGLHGFVPSTPERGTEPELTPV
jgi:hypothetical protein